MSDNPVGKHVIADFSGCSFEQLDNLELLKTISEEAALKCGATILNTYSYKFDPQGVTVNITLSESHLALHSFPENGYLSVDCYTCGDTCNPEIALEYLQEKLQPQYTNVNTFPRGYVTIVEESQNAR